MAKSRRQFDGASSESRSSFAKISRGFCHPYRYASDTRDILCHVIYSWKKTSLCGKFGRYGTYSYLVAETIMHHARMPKYRRIFRRPFENNKRIGDRTFEAIFTHFRTICISLKNCLRIIFIRIKLPVNVTVYHNVIICLRFKIEVAFFCARLR